MKHAVASGLSMMVLLFSASLQAAPGPSMQSATALQTLMLAPGMHPADVLARPDTDLLQTPSGHHMSVGTYRQIYQLRQKLEAQHPAPRIQLEPVSPTLLASAHAEKLGPQTDFAALLNRPADTVIETPAGRRLTVGMLKALRPEIERQTGTPFDRMRLTPQLTGPAKQVGPGDDIQQLLKLPDSTVLDNGKGQRITVAELHEFIQQGDAAKASGQPLTPPTGRLPARP